MNSRRREKRYSSYAKVVLAQDNNLGYLRDLNRYGCHIDFIEKPAVEIGSRIEVRVIPNEEFQLSSFKLILTVKWMRDEKLYHSIGSSLTEIPEKSKEAVDKMFAYFMD